MFAWYNSLLLQNRTDHEKKTLQRVDVSVINQNGGDVIGPRGKPFTRPMSIELTHYHHMEALLAMIACYIDPTVKSLYDYPERHVQFAAAQHVVGQV